MAVVIPTFPDEPNYTIGPTLDGIPYRLTFRLSEREACYFIDLALADGTLLVSGKKLVCSVSIWKHQRYNPNVPQGHLVCGANVGQSQDPPNIGELGLNRRCVLFYYTKAEVGS